ncbi:MAG: hypothetical protein HYR85_12260, partial [Planctomycetes bacterium]|nr:hypothetical protein [Planctomycetota bacterium]
MNPQFDEIAVLKQRVLGIERENRRFKTAAGAGVGLLAILLLSGQSWRQDGVLQARELSLTDAAGKTCMKLSVDEHGRPQIALSDSRGMRRLSIALSDKGEPSVGFARDNGALGLLLDLPDNGGPTVELRQRTGEPRATLELLEDGTPKLHLVDDEGLGGILALADANRSSLQIWDRRG